MALPQDLKEIVPFKTQAELLEDAHDYLLAQSPGVAPRNWSPTGIVYNLIAAMTYVVSAFYDWVTESRAGYSGLLKQAFLVSAEGEALDLHASNRNITRQTESAAVLNVLLISTDGYSSTITIPKSVVVEAASPTNPLERVRFFYTSETTTSWTPNPGDYEAANDSLELEFTAEAPGTAYNVAAESVTRLLTPITGIAGVINPSEPTTFGEDVETDEQLRTRALAAADTGILPSDRRYAAWALEVPGIVSAAVTAPSPRSPCAVDIVVADASGTATQAERDAVLAYVDERKAATDDVEVYAVSPVYVSVTVALEMPKSGTSITAAQAKADAEEALDLVFNQAAAAAEGITAFQVAEDVTAEGILEAIRVKVARNNRRNMRITAVTATSGTWDAVNGILAIASTAVARPGTATVNVTQASDF